MMQQVTIGKDPSNQIVLTNESVSRRHLLAFWNEKQEMILEEPEPSTWGTYIDGRRIKKARLRPGQKVLIGAVPFHSEKLMEQIWRHAKTDRDFTAAYQQQVLPQLLKYERRLRVWKLLEDYLPYISAFAGLSINMCSKDNTVKFCAFIVVFAVIAPLRNFIKEYFDRRKDKLQEAFSDKIVCPNCKNSLMQQDLKTLKQAKTCRICEVKLLEK